MNNKELLELSKNIQKEVNNMPRMLPIKQAAVETGLSYNFIRQLCLQKKIVFVRSGNKYFVNMDKFAEYLDSGGEE